MGATDELRAMATRRELEDVPPNRERALKMLADAERSLKAARSIAEDDPKSALLLAWDGVAFQALAAALRSLAIGSQASLVTTAVPSQLAGRYSASERSSPELM